MTDYVLFLRKTNDSATSFVTELAAAWLLTAQSINTAGGGIIWNSIRVMGIKILTLAAFCCNN